MVQLAAVDTQILCRVYGINLFTYDISSVEWMSEFWMTEIQTTLKSKLQWNAECPTSELFCVRLYMVRISSVRFVQTFRFRTDH